MSSSCVPPKNCVVHNPDPSGHEDHSDTASECGSLCSCTSGSMASVATIGSNNRVPDRQDQDGESTTLVAPVSSIQVQEEDEDNRYFLLRISQREVCCRKLKNLAFRTSLRHFILSLSEFFPWLAGFVIIYYSYRWWGVASGFSAFLFMIGAHAFIRLVKTRGVLDCVPCPSHSQVERDSSDGEDDAEEDLQQVTRHVPIDRSAEKPPSYDVAVVKPPPYDLQLHLTPKNLHNSPSDKPQRRPNTERFTGPTRLSMEERTHSNNNDGSENDVLPSYHDAMKLSLHNEGDAERNGESS